MTLSKQVIQELVNGQGSVLGAIAQACMEGATQKASVRDLRDAISAHTVLTCGQASLSAGLTCAKANGSYAAVCKAMADKASEVAKKAQAKREENKGKAEEAKLAKLEAETKSMRLALHGTDEEKAIAIYDATCEAYDLAEEAFAEAKLAMEEAKKAMDNAKSAVDAFKVARARAEEEAKTADTKSTKKIS